MSYNFHLGETFLPIRPDPFPGRPLAPDVDASPAEWLEWAWLHS